ncbi:hypothetical protein MRX96_010395 [Rhipicephalus microplus]
MRIRFVHKVMRGRRKGEVTSQARSLVDGERDARPKALMRCAPGQNPLSSRKRPPRTDWARRRQEKFARQSA